MKLVEASDAQKLERDVLTHPVWGDGLTLEQYLEREKRLRAHAWPREAMQTWLLEDGGEVLASCETFRNDSFLDNQPGRSWSIASVFTETKLRGRGHALTLMNRLRDHLKAEPGAQGVVLFSEVGPKLYERAGFQAESDSVDHVMEPLDEPVPDAVKLLLAPFGRPERKRCDGLFLWPSEAQLDWHLERSRIYAGFMKRRPLEADGAQCGSARAWFQAYFKSNELLVLWLEGGSDGMLFVLRAAQSLAFRAGLSRVRLWAAPGLALPRPQEEVPRDAELPMVAGFAGAIPWRYVQRGLWV